MSPAARFGVRLGQPPVRDGRGDVGVEGPDPPGIPGRSRPPVRRRGRWCRRSRRPPARRSPTGRAGTSRRRCSLLEANCPSPARRRSWSVAGSGVPTTISKPRRYSSRRVRSSTIVSMTMRAVPVVRRVGLGRRPHPRTDPRTRAAASGRQVGVLGEVPRRAHRAGGAEVQARPEAGQPHPRRAPRDPAPGRPPRAVRGPRCTPASPPPGARGRQESSARGPASPPPRSPWGPSATPPTPRSLDRLGGPESRRTAAGSDPPAEARDDRLGLLAQRCGGGPRAGGHGVMRARVRPMPGSTPRPPRPPAPARTDCRRDGLGVARLDAARRGPPSDAGSGAATGLRIRLRTSRPAIVSSAIR